MVMAAGQPGEDVPPGTAMPVTGGFYKKNGRLEAIKGGEMLTEPHGPHLYPGRTYIDAVDESGRCLVAEGQYRNRLAWQGVNAVVAAWWGAVQWDFDGESVYGEGWDGYSFRARRKYARAAGLGHELLDATV
jgi:hypothetical protein